MEFMRSARSALRVVKPATVVPVEAESAGEEGASSRLGRLWSSSTSKGTGCAPYGAAAAGSGFGHFLELDAPEAAGAWSRGAASLGKYEKVHQFCSSPDLDDERTTKARTGEGYTSSREACSYDSEIKQRSSVISSDATTASDGMDKSRSQEESSTCRTETLGTTPVVSLQDGALCESISMVYSEDSVIGWEDELQQEYQERENFLLASLSATKYVGSLIVSCAIKQERVEAEARVVQARKWAAARSAEEKRGFRAQLAAERLRYRLTVAEGRGTPDRPGLPPPPRPGSGRPSERQSRSTSFASVMTLPGQQVEMEAQPRTPPARPGPAPGAAALERPQGSSGGVTGTSHLNGVWHLQPNSSETPAKWLHSLQILNGRVVDAEGHASPLRVHNGHVTLQGGQLVLRGEALVRIGKSGRSQRYHRSARLP